MTYLKDVKLCIDCAFFGTPQGQQDRCLNPVVTMIHPVHGEEVFPLAFSERTGLTNASCGSKAQYFVLSEDAAADRAKKEKELDEVMRDAPEAVAAEREACALIAQETNPHIALLIRERGAP